MSFHIFDKKKRATCCSWANFRLKSKCKSCTNQVVPLRLQFVDNVKGIADSKLSFYASRRVKRILSQTRCKLVILLLYYQKTRQYLRSRWVDGLKNCPKIITPESCKSSDIKRFRCFYICLWLFFGTNANERLAACKS